MDRKQPVFFAAALATALGAFLFAGCGSGSDGERAESVTGPVAKIVVVDMENCCDCTRERTECTMAALSRALESSDIPVERLHVDTQEDAVSGYRAKKAFMVIPAVYFLAEDGGVLGLLQGEVKEEEVLAALGLVE
ncbi:MAG: hypothetical protein ABIK65_09455 [Candidatus Eisenbacteria bacterium]